MLIAATAAATATAAAAIATAAITSTTITSAIGTTLAATAWQQRHETVRAMSMSILRKIQCHRLPTCFQIVKTFQRCREGVWEGVWE